jgi:hypothetical protein
MIRIITGRPQKGIALLMWWIMFLEMMLPVFTYGKTSAADSRSGHRKNLFYEVFETYRGKGISLAGSVKAPENSLSKKDESKSNKYKADQKNYSPEKTMIGGPGQPEMTTFQSVNTSNMVDLFTGDFSYNVPLLDVGGYPVNLHYSSGVSMDQEASWVGLGFNINPGTISRNMRGLPDDFNGEDKITRTQHIAENKTIGVSVSGGLEQLGFPVKSTPSFGIFYNTYNGWGIEASINSLINVGRFTKGILNGNLGLSTNSQTGIDVNASFPIVLAREEGKAIGSVSLSTNYNSRKGISALQLHGEVKGNKVINFIQKSSPYGIGGMLTFAVPSYTPSIQVPYTNSQFTFSGKIGPAAFGAFKYFHVSGYVSKQYIKKTDEIQVLPAHGYLYLRKSLNQPNALLDFNREKEIAFNPKTTPHIAIPQFTYDIYNISGEGTGGTFRPYRADVGVIRDHNMQTRSGSGNFSLEFGKGLYFHGGADINITNASTKNKQWNTNNNLNNNIKFQEDDGFFQSAYFRNPGERTSNSQAYYQSLGDDKLMRVKLGGDIKNVTAQNTFTLFSNKRPVSDLQVSGVLTKNQRDKRAQVITYNTAEQASLYGADKDIRSYKENTIPLGNCNDTFTVIPRVDASVRKQHHLSEINVLNPDGRRYIYGLPAYNTEQHDITFSVSKESNTANIDRGLVSYQKNSDNTPGNNKGKENFFTKDAVPPYSHSFLLTSLLSADYVDVTGDGITVDDIGDAVKFNYTRIYGPDNGYYSWRTPIETDKANYNEGLKTYSRDDKGTYMYGKKEIWYMNSVESKSMIAVFKISGKREDGLSIVDENGGADTTRRLRKLERIDLFSKADLVKNGIKAKPVKSVHFEYDYSLCGNNPGNSGKAVDKYGNPVNINDNTNVNKQKGKLTLKKIWFSYNGNYKGIRNPYEFYYHPDATAGKNPKAEYNPSHNSKLYDRWGNYKDPSGNPGGLNNVDYPYAEQDSTKAARNAAAWNLTDIKLPSGGNLKIAYEADDYAYIQNRRATRFFQVAGFSRSQNEAPQKNLYIKPFVNSDECDYVFIDVPLPVTGKSDILTYYLQGINKIFLKVAVRMPNDKWGKGYEWIPCYAEPEDYGVVTGNQNRIWIRLKRVDNKNPLILTALQFLRLNLPSKAYPGSETGDNLDLGDAIKIIASTANEIFNVVKGFYGASKIKSWCRETDLVRSFIRLNCPDYKKYGGGLRVKKVEVFDNWNRMTNQKDAVYGQEYNYRTTQRIKGQDVLISSGVATYEPFIGNDENPFREPVEYKEKLSVLAPANYLYSETPLGESMFPAPMVGYSKVTVRTINAKSKSANGWETTQFFTTKDFPTIVDFTPLDGESKKDYNPKLRNFFRVDAVRKMTVSQGFKIELNDMNGKVKSQATYPENDPKNPIRYIANFYKVDNDTASQKHINNNVWVADSANGHINTAGEIGKDIEIMVDMREQESVTFAQNHQANLDAFPIIVPSPLPPFIAFIPVAIPSYYPWFQRETNNFRSVATLKVIQRYGILDSVVVVDKGSVVSTKNLVYDGETGEVLVSCTNNEFNDPVYNFSYPSHWAYTGMGLAYQNVDVVLKNKKILNGKIYEADAYTPVSEKYFESGDEIWVNGREKISGGNEDSCRLFTYSNTVTSKMIWAIDIAKGKDGGKGIYFIDKEGHTYTAMVESMRIVRSGRRNLTDASAGSIMSLANPVREVSAGKFKIVIDSNTRVVNTGAATYKDLWAVDDHVYAKDSCYTKTDTVTLTLPIAKSMLFRKLINRELNPEGEFNVFLTRNIQNGKHFAASHKTYSSTNRRTYLTKSLINFDISQIPSNATIMSASLNLYGKSINGIWKNNDQFLENWDGYQKAHYTSPDVGSAYSATYLRRVTNTAEITSNTHYDNVTEDLTASVSLTGYDDSSCANKTAINVKTLVEKMILNPAHDNGILMKLQNEDFQSSALRSMSFCTGLDGAISANGNPSQPGSNCPNCYKPELVVQFYYQKDTCVKLCKKIINDSSFNPYRAGVLGNWRLDRAFTYYFDRKESDASNTQTNIRKDGELKSFVPYWSFVDTALLKPTADTSKWVWNSAMSLYNKRGFEVENYDPLGRYNAGLYGYGQTLPVAVGQNTKYRSLLYDGFEDYSYQPQLLCDTCQPKKEIDFLKNNASASINSLQSHSGKSSIKVNANTELTLNIPIVTASQDAAKPQLQFTVDSVAEYSGFTVQGLGNGVAAAYTGYSTYHGCSNMVPYEGTRGHDALDFSFYTSPITGMCAENYYATYTGFIQPRYTDVYTFYMLSDNFAGVNINGRAIITDPSNGSEVTGDTITLQAGVLYPIQVDYYHGYSSPAQVQLSWSSSIYQTKEVVPGSLLYTNVNLAEGSLVPKVSGYCTSLKSVKPITVLRPLFSPIQGQKLVMNAWVKIDDPECDPATITDMPFEISFNQGSANPQYSKTGARIEGWQRYEMEVTVPSNATTMTVKLKSILSKNVFFDDFRVHPYNSNIKSMVYDPVSLRLMAELDENNYATYYEYDNDGTLIRVKKETEKGIKTIKESRSTLIRDE